MTLEDDVDLPWGRAPRGPIRIAGWSGAGDDAGHGSARIARRRPRHREGRTTDDQDIEALQAAMAALEGQRATLGDTELERAQAPLRARHPDDALHAKCLLNRAIQLDQRSDAPSSEPLARQALATRGGAAHEAAKSLGHLAWVHCAGQDPDQARTLCDQSRAWAARIERDDRRDEGEAQLQTLSGMVSMLCGRLAEARVTFQAVLRRGEPLRSPRVQIGALDILAGCARAVRTRDGAGAPQRRDRDPARPADARGHRQRSAR